jgi:hypothetical protein
MLFVSTNILLCQPSSFQNSNSDNSTSIIFTTKSKKQYLIVNNIDKTVCGTLDKDNPLKVKVNKNMVYIFDFYLFYGYSKRFCGTQQVPVYEGRTQVNIKKCKPGRVHTEFNYNFLR